MKISKKKAQGVGDRLGVDWSRIDIGQFRRGLEVEQEHWGTVNGDIDMVAKIAWDHLRELPDYYTRLDRMEKEADKETCHWCKSHVKGWDTSYDGYERCPHCKGNPTPTSDDLKAMSERIKKRGKVFLLYKTWNMEARIIIGVYTDVLLAMEGYEQAVQLKDSGELRCDRIELASIKSNTLKAEELPIRDYGQYE